MNKKKNITLVILLLTLMAVCPFFVSCVTTETALSSLDWPDVPQVYDENSHQYYVVKDDITGTVSMPYHTWKSIVDYITEMEKNRRIIESLDKA